MDATVRPALCRTDEQVLIPAIEQLLEQHSKIRLLYVLGSELSGYSAAAMWDDANGWFGASVFVGAGGGGD